MKISTIRHTRYYLLVISGVLSFSGPISPSASATPNLPPQVLDSKVVRHGDHTITYKRIAPPPPATETAPRVEPPPPLTREEIATQQRQAEKDFKTLCLSATVYDRQITELRWTDGNRQYRVFSNINFHILAGGMREFETDTTVYSLSFGIGDGDRNAVSESNRAAVAQGLARRSEVPEWNAFPSYRSSYVIAAESVFGNHRKFSTEQYAALDALHAFYDTNREQLERSYLEREAIRVAHERAPTVPPPSKDTVIEYWKIEAPKSSPTPYAQ